VDALCLFSGGAVQSAALIDTALSRFVARLASNWVLLN
jgi:hypothetical protein